MARLTVNSFRSSGIPAVLGICASDLGSVLSYLNLATQRLLISPEIGDEGWVGSFAKVVFTVQPSSPYIITPREVARLSALDVCRSPIRVQNEWFEFLDFGPKLQSPTVCSDNACAPTQAYERGFVPLPVDLPIGSKLRVFISNAADGDGLHRIFVKGTDGNGNPITTIDNGRQVNGFFITMDSKVPFVDSVYTLNTIQDIAKDITLAPVTLYAVNPTTGVQTLLATFAPSQTSGSYRRYFLGGLPSRCLDCDSPPTSVQVTAMAKLEFVPMTNDTDFLIIGNLAALEDECQSIRYGRMDSSDAEAKAKRHHKNAIGWLQGELIHTYGKRQPALSFKPFGRNTMSLNMT